MRKLLFALSLSTLLLSSCSVNKEPIVAEPLVEKLPQTYEISELMTLTNLEQVDIEITTKYLPSGRQEETKIENIFSGDMVTYKTEEGLFVPIQEALLRPWEQLGITINNEQESTAATITYNNREVYLEQGQMTLYVDNKPTYMAYDIPFMSENILYGNITNLFDLLEYPYEIKENKVIVSLYYEVEEQPETLQEEVVDTEQTNKDNTIKSEEEN